MGEVRDVMRLRHYSIHTERFYCGWIKRFILFLDSAKLSSSCLPQGPETARIDAIYVEFLQCNLLTNLGEIQADNFGALYPLPFMPRKIIGRRVREPGTLKIKDHGLCRPRAVFIRGLTGCSRMFSGFIESGSICVTRG
jgi:hypothetical protein